MKSYSTIKAVLISVIIVSRLLHSSEQSGLNSSIASVSSSASLSSSSSASFSSSSYSTSSSSSSYSSSSSGSSSSSSSTAHSVSPYVVKAILRPSDEEDKKATYEDGIPVTYCPKRYCKPLYDSSGKWDFISSKDGRLLTAFEVPEKDIVLWDITNQSLGSLHQLKYDKEAKEYDSLRTLNFSPYGTYVVWGIKHTLTILNLATRKKNIFERTRTIEEVCFSHDESFFVTTDRDGVVLWELRPVIKEECVVFKPSKTQKFVKEISISKENTMVGIIEDSNTPKWRLLVWKKIVENASFAATKVSYFAQSLHLLPDGKTVVVTKGTDGDMQFYNIAGEKPQKKGDKVMLPLHPSWLQKIVFAPTRTVAFTPFCPKNGEPALRVLREFNNKMETISSMELTDDYYGHVTLASDASLMIVYNGSEWRAYVPSEDTQSKKALYHHPCFDKAKDEDEEA